MKQLIATSLGLAAGVSAALADDAAANLYNTSLQPELRNPWQFSASAGVTVTRGNSQTALFNADFSAVKKTAANEYLFNLAGAYGNNHGAETVNNYKGAAQWNHLFDERFYGYLRGDALRDVIADLDYRATIGPGVGYYFVKEKDMTLAGEAGIAFTSRRLGGKSDNYATPRFADRYEWKFSDHARLWQSAEYLPQIDKWGNYIINGEIGVEAMMTGSLSLKTYLDDMFQSRPADGRLKNDLQIVAAVGYKF